MYLLYYRYNIASPIRYFFDFLVIKLFIPWFFFDNRGTLRYTYVFLFLPKTDVVKTFEFFYFFFYL